MKLITIVLFIGLLMATTPLLSFADPTCGNYDAGMHWVSTINSSHSSTPSLAVVGDLAYVNIGSLHVVDLADPENPEIINTQSYPRYKGGLDANEYFLVVGAMNSIPEIEIYSLADPRQPEFLLRYQFPNDVNDLCLVGDMLYASCTDEGIVAVSLADPMNPQIMATVGAGGSYRVTHQGSYLYGLVGSNTMHREVGIYDISSPGNPVEVYRGHPGGIDIVTGGDKLYMAKGTSGFEMADISGQFADDPNWLGVFEENLYVKTMAANDNYVFTASGLNCIDITGQAPWPVVSSQETGFGTNAVVLYNDYAIVANSYSMEIFDVSKPAPDVSILSTYSSAGETNYQLMVTSGNIAFLANRIFLDGAKIEVIDISDPDQPVLKQTIDTVGLEVTGLAIWEEYLYVSVLNGVEIFDVSDEVLIHSVGFIPSSGSSYKLRIIKDHLYIADFTGGVQIVSLIDDPTEPVVVGNFPGEVKLIWAADPYLFVRSGSENIVLDISDPTAPFSMGSFAWDIFHGTVLIQDSVAYVGKVESIEILDLSDPVSPQLLTSIPVSQPISGMDLTDGKLYAATNLGTLFVLDVTDPVNTQTLGDFYFGAFYVRGLIVNQGSVFVLSDHALTTLPVDCSGLSPVSPEDIPGSSLLQLAAWPNPFNPQVKISFRLQSPGSFELQVFDLAGRQIRTLLVGQHEGGGFVEAAWDGTDNQNRSVASGVYLVRLQAGHQIASKKLILAR